MTPKRKGSGGIVFSTEHGRMCPGCGNSIGDCECRQTGTASKGDGVVRIRMDRQGRGSSRNWAPWLIAIAVIFVIWLATNGDRSDKNVSSTPSSSGPGQETLASRIEARDLRAKEMELEIAGIDDLLDTHERRMRSFQTSGMTDEYNRLVPVFNSLTDKRDALFEEYSNLVSEVNAQVARFNAGQQ